LNKIETLVEQYFRHLTVERGMAKNTLLSYRRDIGRYLAYLEGLKISDLAEIDERLISDFVQSLSQVSGLAQSSVARILSSVRGLHHFWLVEGISPVDPAATVRPPKQRRSLPKAITIKQMLDVLDAAGPEWVDERAIVQDPIKLRDRALVEFLYASGARISEILALDLDDVADDRQLRLFGKGSKERTVMIGKPARKALEAYLVRVRPGLVAAGRGTPAVFLNQRGGRLSRQSAWSIISEAGETAGLGFELSPHTLRHSFATHMLEGGAGVREVQMLLGHSSVTTTQIYTLVTVDKLREVYANAHPRARR
jgi:integrase/recombinase XerD